MFQRMKLKNGKYYIGSYKKGFSKSKGWFLGSFFEKGSPFKTDKVEICYKQHKKGDKTEAHYHRKKVEILIFLTGKARYTVNGRQHIIGGGEFIFVDVNNVIEGEFLKSSKIIAIHSPSLPKDKVELNK